MSRANIPTTSRKPTGRGWLPRACRLLLAACCTISAARNAPEKPKVVDAGSFAVFVKGERIASETFHIEQGREVSVATSEFKALSGEKSWQKAELQIASSGDLRRYEWHELSPGKSHITVEPADQFLIEHLVPNPPDHPVDQTFLVPLSTVVLDDYFFSQREILAWRYLAQACGGALAHCRPGPVQFGVLNPRQRTQAVVTVEYAGPEKVTAGGVERQFNRLNLKVSEEPDWVLYLDENLKLVRITVPTEQTVVARE
jgi:hypothetical protein